MPGRALLDTSAAAAFLRGDQVLSATIAQLDEVYASVVVVGELLYGARHSSNPTANLDRVSAFVAAISVLPSDHGTAEIYARVKQDLRAKGRPIPDNDLWIASSAIQHGLALVHRDAHFDQIDELVRETW